MSELNPALAALNAGRLDESRKLLTRLLQKSAGNLDAQYLLAVTEQSLNHHEVALDLYDKVLRGNPRHGWAHYNKALLLSGRGQHLEALPHHDQAVLLAPVNFWAFVNRGNAKAALRHFDAAIADYDSALALQPGLPNALTNKGNALFEQGRHAEALPCLEAVIKSHPKHVEAWVSHCQTLTKLGRPSEALISADRALELSPQHPDAWIRKGAALLELDRSEEALAMIEKTLTMHPTYAKAWSAQGDALVKLDRTTEALASYDKALALDPNLIHGYVNKGMVLQFQGKYAQAQSHFEKALEHMPDHVDANRNLSYLLLGQHDYKRGWEKYEYRWRSSTEQPPKQLPTSRPLWTGNKTQDTLLLWGEQGIGDQILYASILPDLLPLNAHTLVALDKRLLPLFARSMPNFEHLDLALVTDALDFSAQLPLGSLPRYFRPTVESFSNARTPYLLADPARTAHLRQKIVQPGKRVCGISWSSNRKDIGTEKSISLDQMLAPLASTPLHFVNLQYGDTSTEREDAQRRHGITVMNVDEVDNFNDIDGLAALIQACDVVITTSNTTAHLAGALGKETLLLLPFGKGRIWYWSEHAGKNLWYPSIRIFSQDQPGQWQRALAQVRLHLESKTWN